MKSKKKKKLIGVIRRIRDADITDSYARRKNMRMLIYLLLAVVSTVMSIVNIITGVKTLLAFTASFAVLCLLNFFLTYKDEKGEKIASILFIFELFILFSYFLITGGTDNFSVIWLLLLPTLGLYFFGIKLGSALCAFLLVEMVLLFHVPSLMQICTDYGGTFRARFPIVFISAYIVSLGMEYIRNATQQQLYELRQKYELLSKSDRLTELPNRNALDEMVTGFLENHRTIGMLEIDIDDFKMVNDTYGHDIGDYVLVEMANVLLTFANRETTVFRWGGEEFVIICEKPQEANELAEKVVLKVREHIFDSLPEGRNHLTVSVGSAVGTVTNKESFDKLFCTADRRLYKAKETGKNKAVVS